MDNRAKERKEETGVDLQRLLNAIAKRIWLIIAVTVAAAVVTFMVTFYLITPQYRSSAMFYVNNNSFSVGDTSLSISSSDLVASKSLVNSYIVILNSRESLNDVIDYAGVDYTYEELKKMLTSSAVNDTEIFQVDVTSPDPQEAERIASAITYILPKRISSIIEGTSAKIVDSAVVPSEPCSPSFIKNVMVGSLLGILLSVGIIALREIFDISIREEDDIARGTSYPILATVPNMHSTSKGGYYYGAYGQRRKHTAAQDASQKEAKPLFGSNISFAASEAYKLLRTKLQFSFADEKSCRVIGISSALAGEGKSLTSINLAHTLSELNKRVILIDCDMRRPSLCEKLSIEKNPGLSDYLSGQSGLEELLQNCNLVGEEESFRVIASGRNPPNPIELLSSERMSRMLEKLKPAVDYIILDLPPVNEVSDAMAIAKHTDGILLVVRQNRCNYVDLSAAVHEFEFVDTKILGIVFNGANEQSSTYGKYRGRYSGRYNGKYYRYGSRSDEARGKRDRKGRS